MTSETTRDGSQVWKLNERTLLAVTDKATYVAKQSVEDTERIYSELVTEGVPADIGLPEARKIEHKAILMVLGYEKKPSIEFRYYSLRVLATGSRTEFEVDLPDKETIAEIQEALQARLGPKAKLKRKVYSPLRSLVAPLVTAGIIGVLSWAFASVTETETADVEGRYRLVKEILLKLAVAIGPAGVIAIGVLAVAGCVVWGCMRFKDPPIISTLKPK